MNLSIGIIILAGWMVVGLVPCSANAQNPRSAPVKKPQRSKVVDVLLGDENSLRGQIRQSSEQIVGDSVVAIWQGPQLIWKGTVDKAGHFQLPNLTSGLYKVVYDDEQVMLRTWSRDTAPPQTSGSLILNREKRTVNSYLPKLTPNRSLFPPIWSGTHDDPRLRTRP